VRADFKKERFKRAGSKTEAIDSLNLLFVFSMQRAVISMKSLALYNSNMYQCISIIEIT